MIEQCCQDILTPRPTGKSKQGNDFSVREVLLCILEIERSGLFPKETTNRWRAAMAKLDPYAIYRNVAPQPARAGGQLGSLQRRRRAAAQADGPQ